MKNNSCENILNWVEGIIIMRNTCEILNIGHWFRICLTNYFSNIHAELLHYELVYKHTFMHVYRTKKLLVRHTSDECMIISKHSRP